MSDDKVKVYPGKDAEVSWHGDLCIHIGECGRAKGDLFVGGRDPWCQPDVSGVDDVADVVERCPTGALTYRRKDGADEVPDSENTIVVAYDGPLFVRGELDVEGAPAETNGVEFRAALCRCGKSANKPFCDNSHIAANFRDYGAVGETGDGATGSGGPLSVKRAANGPLLLSGNFKIVASSGRVAWSGSKAALCRCGESKNKPFCDGTHKAAGFTAE